MFTFKDKPVIASQYICPSSLRLWLSNTIKFFFFLQKTDDKLNQYVYLVILLFISGVFYL